MLIDTHCHLDFADFEEERDAIVARAHEMGVKQMVTISTKVRKLDGLLALTERYPSVFCSVGTHPNSADQELDIQTEDLIRLANRHEKIVAIGEAGLDYFYDTVKPEDQKTGFLRHIAAARETQLPLVIHSRSADEDMAAILTEETGRGLSLYPPLLLRRPCPCRDRCRAWRLYLLLRHPDLSEIGRAARDCQDDPARPAAGRDRRALSRAEALARQA